MQSRENQERAVNLKAAFNADRKMLRDKIDDLERKLTNQMTTNQSLQQKIHMLLQQEGAQKNELNFWNGKVTTMRRDLENQHQFSESLQQENQKITAELAEVKRQIELRDREIALSKKEVAGLQEDNDRINRMYLLVQKEAVNGMGKLKDEAASQPVKNAKPGYQPLRNDGQAGNVVMGPNPNNKKTQNMWQVVDDGFGSSRDFSNITGFNNAVSEGPNKDQQITLKREFA